MRFYKIVLPLALVVGFVRACNQKDLTTIHPGEVGFILEEETATVIGCDPYFPFPHPKNVTTRSKIVAGPYMPGKYDLDVGGGRSLIRIECGTRYVGTYFGYGNYGEGGLPGPKFSISVKIDGDAVVPCNDKALMQEAAESERKRRDGSIYVLIAKAREVLDAVETKTKNLIIPGCVHDEIGGDSQECIERIDATIRNEIKGSGAIDMATLKIEIKPR